MKWLIVSDMYSSLEKWLQGAPLSSGSPAPAFFIDFLIDRGEEVTLVVPGIGSDADPTVSIKLLPVPPRRLLSWRPVLNLRPLRRMVREENPDIIYCTGPNAAFCAIIARQLGIPCITRFYGTTLMRLFRRPGSSSLREYRFALGELAAVKLSKDGIVISDDGTQGDIACRRLGVKADNLLFIRNGVDKQQLGAVRRQTDVAEVRRQWGLSAEDFVVVNACRLDRWKRVELVIKGLQSLHSLDHHDAEKAVLLIVGSNYDASYESELKTLAQASGGRIRFLGDLAKRDLWKLMRSCDVVTSFYDLSNVGNVLLEALHLNTVAVARDTGGTSRVITHGLNGFLVPEKPADSVSQFAQILRQLIRDRRSCKEVAANAVAWAAGNLMSWPDRFELEYSWIVRRTQTCQLPIQRLSA